MGGEMSIASMADDEILRTERHRLVPVISADVIPEFGTLRLTDDDKHKLRQVLMPVAAADPIQKTPGSSALDGLVNYIPTESVTLYVAATAALSSLQATFPILTPTVLYWGFVVLTPVLFILIYLGKRQSMRGVKLLPEFKHWPWWKLVAATIAFMVWALAVPPLVTSDAGKIVAAFGAILVSTVLTLIGAVVEPPEVAPTTRLSSLLPGSMPIAPGSPLHATSLRRRFASSRAGVTEGKTAIQAKTKVRGLARVRGGKGA
jgi:hypothetical protein